MTWWPLREGPGGNEPRPVAASLEATARRLGAPGVGILATVFAHWTELVGTEVAAHAQPRSLRAGALVVDVDQPVWATQLRYLSADVLDRVREASGVDTVRELRIQVTGAPGRQARPSRPQRRPDTPL